MEAIKQEIKQYLNEEWERIGWYYLEGEGEYDNLEREDGVDAFVMHYTNTIIGAKEIKDKFIRTVDGILLEYINYINDGYNEMIGEDMTIQNILTMDNIINQVIFYVGQEWGRERNEILIQEEEEIRQLRVIQHLLITEANTAPAA